MIEIYNDIPIEVKRQAKFWFEVAMCQPNIAQTLRMLKDYSKSCSNEYEREFVNFYFNMRMQEIYGKENTNE